MEKVTERQLVSFDWAMKRLLRSKANFVILEGFLSELLLDDIKILEVLESETNKDSDDDKYNRVDVKVRNSKGELIIVEVQFNNEDDFFHRILYSVSKTVCEHLKKGDKYEKVVKVISVNILYFDLGMGSDYIYRGTTVFKGLHNDSTLKLSVAQQEKFQKELPNEIFPEYYILKINNFNNVAKCSLDEWIYLFKNSAIKSNFKAKGIKEAGEALNEMQMTEQERKAYERYIDNLRFSKGLYDTAINTGRRLGREEGISELIHKMLDMGRSAEEIADFVGMDIEDIQKLLGKDYNYLK